MLYLCVLEVPYELRGWAEARVEIGAAGGEGVLRIDVASSLGTVVTTLITGDSRYKGTSEDGQVSCNVKSLISVTI
jgi:hypothetical protein